MKKTISKYEFVEEFKAHDRMSGWTVQGLDALYQWLEEIGEDGPEIELDVIALDCEFTQYDDLKDFQNNGGYGLKFKSLDKLSEETLVIQVDDSDSFIVQQF
jgi:hypothetical protein